VLAEKRQEPRFEIAGTPPAGATTEPEQAGKAEADPDSVRGRVADVIMPEARILADEPRRRPGRRVGGIRQHGSDEAPDGGKRSSARNSARNSGRSSDAARDGNVTGARGRGAEKQDSRDRRGRGRTAERSASSGEPVVQELIVINVVAPRGQHFEGPALVEGLRARGLRYGEMNIFHRVEPMTRAVQYSVANVLEPGTFDMADIESFRSPGVCFFMQLPGPENPLEAFEDMLKAARNLALQLGGELKDEQRSVMTGQTVEHYRQRIAEFRRRLMSMRA
jgi:cell division protein ZipA